MPAYQFLGISEKTTPHGVYKQADVKIHGTDKQTSFNHDLFKEIVVGTHFIMDRDKSYPQNPVTPIYEAEIPGILKRDEEARQANQAAYEKKKAENIATGRFKYFYTDFREGKAENIIEILSENYDEFWQILADNINSNKRLAGEPKETKVTVEQLKKDERHVKFMDKARPGDKLGWYSWNGGPMAYSAGPCLLHNDVMFASEAWIVS